MNGLLVLLLGLVLLLLGIVIWLTRAPGRRAVKRSRRALRGEADAEALLEGEGWVVRERQHSAEGAMRIDGELVYYTVRIDLLVERDGDLAVAEVKTGGRAPDPAFGPTRRQLLEYSVLFPDCRVLLVDVEAGLIHEVELCWPGEEPEEEE